MKTTLTLFSLLFTFALNAQELKVTLPNTGNLPPYYIVVMDGKPLEHTATNRTAMIHITQGTHRFQLRYMTNFSTTVSMEFPKDTTRGFVVKSVEKTETNITATLLIQ